jgi:CheY-like chemotaxis protein
MANSMYMDSVYLADDYFNPRQCAYTEPGEPQALHYLVLSKFLLSLPLVKHLKNCHMKILVVDDERDVQILFVQKFRKEIRNGHMHFIFAFSGEEALAHLAAHPHEAVLILSDINMPGMSGIDLLKKIKQEHRVPPPFVMMITAYGDAENYNMAMRYGADDFLTKPLEFNVLKEKLEAIL